MSQDFLDAEARLLPKKQALEQMEPALPSKTDEHEAIELTRLTCLPVISCWDLMSVITYVLRFGN